MGRSGGYSKGSGGMSLADLYARASAATDQSEYDAEVNQLIQDMLKDFNNRDVVGINKHLDTIEQAISNQIEGTVRLLFGGSVHKHTYVNGLSDVDVLVCINDTSLAGKSPREILTYFAGVLKQRLPNTEIGVGNLAVTVTFSDGHQIQLLPAVKTAQGFKIAEPGGDNWSNVISPQRFAQKLTSVNQSQNGRVVPVIKIIKAMNEHLPKELRLSGYHIESLAIEAFEKYKGDMTHKAMIQHFWREAVRLVLAPINDHTGQSIHVDDALGRAGSEQRTRLSHVIQQVATNLDRYDEQRSVENWQEILEK